MTAVLRVTLFVALLGCPRVGAAEVAAVVDLRPEGSGWTELDSDVERALFDLAGLEEPNWELGSFELPQARHGWWSHLDFELLDCPDAPDAAATFADAENRIQDASVTRQPPPLPALQDRARLLACTRDRAGWSRSELELLEIHGELAKALEPGDPARREACDHWLALPPDAGYTRAAPACGGRRSTPTPVHVVVTQESGASLEIDARPVPDGASVQWLLPGPHVISWLEGDQVRAARIRIGEEPEVLIESPPPPLVAVFDKPGIDATATEAVRLWLRPALLEAGVDAVILLRSVLPSAEALVVRVSDAYPIRGRPDPVALQGRDALRVGFGLGVSRAGRYDWLNARISMHIRLVGHKDWDVVLLTSLRGHFSEEPEYGVELPISVFSVAAGFALRGRNGLIEPWIGLTGEGMWLAARSRESLRSRLTSLSAPGCDLAAPLADGASVSWARSLHRVARLTGGVDIGGFGRDLSTSRLTRLRLSGSAGLSSLGCDAVLAGNRGFPLYGRGDFVFEALGEMVFRFQRPSARASGRRGHTE